MTRSTLLASAQLDAALAALPALAASPALLPTNVEGARAFAAPPAGFDPLRASDEDLAAYGFPARPDAITDRAAYAGWAHAMQHARTHVQPVLQVTNIQHKPMQRGTGKAQAVTTASSVATTSSNWSGEVLYKGLSYFGNTSFATVWTEFNIPVAQQAFGGCDGGWDYSSTWDGIDGFGSGDVLQGGTESDAYCSGGNTASYYAAWYEWYPNYETRITSLPVTAGDAMFVYVHAYGPATGYVFIENLTTGQYASIDLTAPSGTSLIGDSAEWVVERPGVNGGLATLTNYVTDWMSYTYAEPVKGRAVTPTTAGRTATAYSVTMTDNSGNGISYPNSLGPTGIQFYDEGSAY